MIGSISVTGRPFTPVPQKRVFPAATRFGHGHVPPQPGDPATPKKSGGKIPYLYSFLEGSAVIGALYGVMELTERNPEYFSEHPGLKLMISVGLFGLHQLSHLGLFMYGMHVGKRVEKEKHEAAPDHQNKPVEPGNKLDPL